MNTNGIIIISSQLPITSIRGKQVHFWKHVSLQPKIVPNYLKHLPSYGLSCKPSPYSKLLRVSAGVFSKNYKGGDSSYVVRLGISKLPKETNKPEQALAAIIFSAFGKLALAHEVNHLHEGMFDYMLTELKKYGYIYVPWNAVYNVPYDGEKYRKRFAGSKYSWYDRFFNEI